MSMMDKETRAFLTQIAQQLEYWARQSVAGGWSTHQVEPQKTLARNIYEYLGRRPTD